MDGQATKNKDPIQFVADIQEARCTQTYLTKKREMKSIYDGITYAKDLAKDYVFGIKTEEG